MKTGRQYQGRRDEWKFKKGKRKQYHLSYDITALGKDIKLGRISSCEEGQKIWGRKSRLREMAQGEEYQVVGNFKHPFLHV